MDELLERLRAAAGFGYSTLRAGRWWIMVQHRNTQKGRRRDWSLSSTVQYHVGHPRVGHLASIKFIQSNLSSSFVNALLTS